MNTSKIAHSATGRLTRSEPEQQYFPGTRQALAQERKLRASRQAMQACPVPLVRADFTQLEMRVVRELSASIRVVRPAR